MARTVPAGRTYDATLIGPSNVHVESRGLMCPRGDTAVLDLHAHSLTYTEGELRCDLCGKELASQSCVVG